MNPATFTTEQRIHVSLDVRDLQASLEFYRALLAVEPSKVRPDYAKFEPAEPPVNLALNLASTAPARESRVSHFGIQVKSSADVKERAARLAAAGLAPLPQEQVTCCYAIQDKAWVTDPDGNAWEVFAVTGADAPVHSERPGGPGPNCCPTDSEASCC